MLRVCRPTLASSSARWTSLMSTSLKDCRLTVAIDQKSTSRNPRSTVGTITEVYDYLRCSTRESVSRTVRSVASHRPSDPQRRLSTRSSSSRAGRDSRSSRHSYALGRVSTSISSAHFRPGASRARIDGVVHSLAEPPKLKKREKHTIGRHRSPRGEARRETSTHRLCGDRAAPVRRDCHTRLCRLA